MGLHAAVVKTYQITVEYCEINPRVGTGKYRSFVFIVEAHA